MSGVITLVLLPTARVEHLTLAATRALANADAVMVEAPLTEQALRDAEVPLPRVVDDSAQDELAQFIQAGRNVAQLVTTWDAASVAAWRQQGIRVEVIPGLEGWTAARTYAGLPANGAVTYLDARRDVPPAEMWPTTSAVVVEAGQDSWPQLASQGQARFGADATVLCLQDAGEPSQHSQELAWAELAELDGSAYLLIGSDQRPGEWMESRPLHTWKVVIPQTKDSVEPMVEAVARYGAVSEVVPTLSVEPPRNEEVVERALRGIVDGRYLWIIFTSPHAVHAVMSRLEQLGLDSRAVSGILLAAVGVGTTEALARYGLKADLTPHDENTSAQLALEFPAYDELMDPLSRILVPTADVAVEQMVDGLTRLGWEVEEVTAFRVLRAAPPPAEVRERIKDGQFDVAIFTSATSVRNMLGLAGKPHAATLVAAIGPATAEACEEHGLRVDVVSPSTHPGALAAALADFAEQRRADRLAQGLPDTKPSQRTRRRRRKPTSSK